MTPRVAVTMLFARRLAFVCLTGFVLAACDAAPPSAEPPSGELPCAGATADGTWEALSPPDLAARRLRLHGDYLYAAAGRDGFWRRDLTSGQPPAAPWESLGLGLDSTRGTEFALDILADPTDPDRMMAAVEPIAFTGTERPSVFRTTDGGQTWEDVSDGDEFLLNPDFRAVVRRLYGEGDGEEPGVVRALGGAIYLTRDYGQTWEEVRAPGSPSGPTLFREFDPAERHPNYPGVVWTGTTGIDFQAMVSRSSDAGASWERVPVCPPMCADSYPLDFAFDAADERVAYFATSGWYALLKSEDFGTTWRNIDALSLGEYKALLGDPEQSQRLWAGLDRVIWPRFRVFVTEDEGETWVEIEVPTGVVAEGARVFDFEWEESKEAILVGTSHGVYRYRPGLSTGLECD